MVNRKRSVILILGIGLILVSLCLVIALQIRTNTGFQKSRQVLDEMQGILPERTSGMPGVMPDSCMPVLEIEGVDYVALLEVPAFGITLPVADKWKPARLAVSPARFSGSSYDHTLILGGTDDLRQFGFCGQIEHGTLIRITDMTGAQFVYTVCGIDRAKHAETGWLADAEWDLTLFCHDVSALEYIAVRCAFAYNG